jgi:hypothetical protein
MLLACRVRLSLADGLGRVVRVADQNLVTIFIRAMVANMERYPEDQLSIYRCHRDFGSLHGDYIGLYFLRQVYLAPLLH